MEEQNSNVYKCPHCEGTGVCTSDEGKSCGTCLESSKIKNGSSIVRCDICYGYGRTEIKSERLKNRAPIIVMSIVLLAFYIYAIANIGNDQHFNQIFPLLGSLTTMIVTFFFAKK